VRSTPRRCWGRTGCYERAGATYFSGGRTFTPRPMTNKRRPWAFGVPGAQTQGSSSPRYRELSVFCS
jgi:hypothetical protein